jgi:hypothetical protein
MLIASTCLAYILVLAIWKNAEWGFVYGTRL